MTWWCVCCKEQWELVLSYWGIDGTGLCHNHFGNEYICLHILLAIFPISSMTFTTSGHSITSLVSSRMRSYSSQLQGKGFPNFPKEFLNKAVIMFFATSLKLRDLYKVEEFFWINVSKNWGIFSANSPSTMFIFILWKTLLYKVLNIKCTPHHRNFYLWHKTESSQYFLQRLIWLRVFLYILLSLQTELESAT